MKIVFMCGALEPGKDGVGDYTRLLSSELVTQGHEVAIISLNDIFIDKNDISSSEVNFSFTILRLSASIPWIDRIKQAKEFIDIFNPEWLSLQYVPYSFNAKGLPWKLPGYMKELSEGRKFTIMFHEIWIGISKISPLKHKIIGFFQRNIAKNVVKATNPELVITSNIIYKLILKSAGINAQILPLFSNIPKVEANMQDMHKLYFDNGINFDNAVVTGIFGALYPEAKLESIITDFVKNPDFTGKQLVFVSVGRIGNYGLEEFNRLSLLFNGQVKFVLFGEKSQQEISNILQTFDFVISCTPVEHLGKSGVFAALKLHGLKVIMSGSEEIPEYKNEVEQYLKNSVEQSAESWGVEYISKKFIYLLKKQHI